MSPVDFIEVYDDALPSQACAALVAQFEASGAAVPGSVGGGVHRDLKDSDDITISGKPEWRDAELLLNQAVFHGMARYLRRHDIPGARVEWPES